MTPPAEGREARGQDRIEEANAEALRGSILGALVHLGFARTPLGCYAAGFGELRRLPPHKG